MMSRVVAAAALLMLLVFPVPLKAEGETEIAPMQHEPLIVSDDDLLNEWETAFPLSVTGERFDGGGTLVDYVITGNKHFYTIVTRTGSAFYLIIDYDKELSNVYFLTEVDQQALADANTNRQNSNSASMLGASAQQPQQQEVVPAAQQTPSQNPGNTPPPMLVMVAAVFLAVFVFGYYSKIHKTKKQKAARKNMPDASDEQFFDDEIMFGYDNEN
jgi:hypothetical protein